MAQVQLREEINKMIRDRKRIAQQRDASEKAADVQRAVLRAEQANEPQVLYRCPATGRVLPPTAFNIPRKSWQSPSVTAFL
jgi:hypothetical protein